MVWHNSVECPQEEFVCQNTDVAEDLCFYVVNLKRPQQILPFSSHSYISNITFKQSASLNNPVISIASIFVLPV